MINKIKLGVNLIKYSSKLGKNVFSIFIILIIGIIVEVLSKGTNFLGGFYLLIAGLFVSELVTSLDLTDLIQTSPLKKQLQTSIPVVVSNIIYLVLFTVLLIEKAILLKIYPASGDEILKSILCVVLLNFIAIVYNGICFKYYIFSIIGLMLTVGGVSPFNNSIYQKIIEPFNYDMKWLVIIIMGYVLILLGGLIEYGIRCLLYKKPLSKIAFNGAFRDMK